MSAGQEDLRRLVEGLYEAVDANDLAAIGALFCADAMWERPDLSAPLGSRAEIVEFYRDRRHIAEGRHRVEHIAVDGDCGAAWGAFAGTRTDGAAVTLRYADCFTFAGGLIRTRRSHVY